MDSTRFIIDLCIDAHGTAVMLTAKSFHILQQNQDIPIDVEFQNCHSSACTAICCMSPLQNASFGTLPNIILASRCTVSSWRVPDSIQNEKHVNYQLQSKVQREEEVSDHLSCSGTSLNPTILCLSPCQSALSLVIGRSVSIYAVAKNIGLAYCKYSGQYYKL